MGDESSDPRPTNLNSAPVSSAADSVNPFRINPADPFYEFSKLCSGVKEKIENIDPALFFINGDNYNKNTKNQLLTKISRDDNNCIKCPNGITKEFVDKIVEIFNNCNAWEGLSMWPPRILEPTEEAKAVTYILVDFLSSFRTAQAARRWFEFVPQHCIPEECKTNKLFSSNILKACCLCYRKRKIFTEKRHFWATLDVHNHFQLWVIEDGQLVLNTNEDIDEIMLSRSGNTIKLFKDGELVKKIVPIDPYQYESWMKAMQKKEIRPKFPVFLSNFEQPVPDLILFALNESILSSDYYFVRSLVDFRVISVSKAQPMMEALFDIFAYAGKVNDLMMLLSGLEFAAPELQINTVLRGNSHLTNLFKVFFKRFGTKYYTDFLRRIVLYIDSKGDLELRTPPGANAQVARTMVFTVLERVAGSLQHVPPEIRHFASVLKTCASQRFNSKQATYNTLSGFFYLRFVSSVLSNPLETDPGLKLKNQWTKVLVPATQLLMQPFNLIEMTGRYEAFNSWNRTLRKQIFPKLIDFAFSVAVPVEVQYAPPTKERLRESLITVLSFIDQSQTKFREYYLKLSENTDVVSPIGLNLAKFISSYFEQNSSA
jgi:hypothetical protein